MTIIVKVGEAKTTLSQLLARVEAGEDVVIARGDHPVARLQRIQPADARPELLAAARAARSRGGAVATDEVLAWRDTGRR